MKKYQVGFAHAEQALRDLSAITIEDPDAMDEQRFITLGMDALGRVLVIQRAERTRLISARRKEYDFSKGKRGPVVKSPGKTRITIMLDNEVIEAFREQAETKGIGYQTAINEALRSFIFRRCSAYSKYLAANSSAGVA